jgi:hypothetical protein
MPAPLRLCRLPILALFLLLAPLSRSRGTATTRTGHDFTYYSNASHTTVVGYCFVCVGYSGCHGTITPYYVIGNYPCR